MSSDSLKAFKEGEEACLKFGGDPSLTTNIYTKNTDSWFFWNRGWNNQLNKL